MRILKHFHLDELRTGDLHVMGGIFFELLIDVPMQGLEEAHRPGCDESFPIHL